MDRRIHSSHERTRRPSEYEAGEARRRQRDTLVLICALRSLVFVLCFVAQARQVYWGRARYNIACSPAPLARMAGAMADNRDIIALLLAFAFLGLCCVARGTQGRARGLALATISIFGGAVSLLIIYGVKQSGGGLPPFASPVF